MSMPADKTSDIRPLAEAELDHVSGGWAGVVALAQAHATPTTPARSSGVINQHAISLPKPAYPPIA